MWIKSSDGKELNKCIRVYVNVTKKSVELKGVIDCSTYGEQVELLASYNDEQAAKDALNRIEEAIMKGEKVISL